MWEKVKDWEWENRREREREREREQKRERERENQSSNKDAQKTRKSERMEEAKRKRKRGDGEREREIKWKRDIERADRAREWVRNINCTRFVFWSPLGKTGWLEMQSNRPPTAFLSKISQNLPHHFWLNTHQIQLPQDSSTWQADPLLEKTQCSSDLAWCICSNQSHLVLLVSSHPTWNGYLRLMNVERYWEMSAVQLQKDTDIQAISCCQVSVHDVLLWEINHPIHCFKGKGKQLRFSQFLKWKVSVSCSSQDETFDNTRKNTLTVLFLSKYCFISLFFINGHIMQSFPSWDDTPSKESIFGWSNLIILATSSTNCSRSLCVTSFSTETDKCFGSSGCLCSSLVVMK